MGYSLSTASPFLKGLNTELNKLVDSTEYTNDELNCMIRANNTRSRRPGLDYEELYKFNNEYLDLSKPDLAFQCIEWTDINSPDESETYTGYPYLVCQVGGKIIFFRNEGEPYSGHQEEYTLDLADYALDATDAYTRERCKFTAAYGCIFITSKAIRPIYLRSAQAPEEPSVPVVMVPTGTLSVAVPNSKKGRWAAWGSAEFFVNDISVGKCTIQDYNDGRIGNCSAGPWMLCSTQLADFWNNLPASSTMGITATPKFTDGTATRWGIHSDLQPSIELGGGAYVADYLRFEAPVESGSTLKGTKIAIEIRGMWQTRSDSGVGIQKYSCALVGGSSYVHKNNLNLTIRDTTIGAQDYLNIEDAPTKMSYAHLYNLLNQGWTPQLIAKYYANVGNETFPANNLAQQFLKDEQTAAFKPENMINMTFGNTPAARGHEKLAFFNQERVSASNLVNTFTQLIADLNSETGTTKTFQDYVDTSWDLDDPTQANETDALSQVPNIKPRKNFCADICNYAGRIFYLSGDVLLYSQVIAEDITRADMCYTEADPTSESISDVVETDGGLISLPDIGEGIKLQPCGDSLLVFGTRGNMIISGTVNNIFTATAYGAGAINAVPTQAPDSFVSTEYGVFYWGTTGIQFVTQAERGVQTKDLSTEKILTFYGKLNNDQHKYCKGIYSSSKKKVYWFYPSNTDMPRRLDMCLVYDIQRDAFTPQQIVSEDSFQGEANIQTPEVVSGTQLKVPYKSVKEYPLYADLIVPDDTKEFLYMKAVGDYNRYVPGQANYVKQADDAVDDQGHLVPSQTSVYGKGYIEGNNNFYSTRTNYDLVVKFKIDSLDPNDSGGMSPLVVSDRLPGGWGVTTTVTSIVTGTTEGTFRLKYADVEGSVMVSHYSPDIPYGKYCWLRIVRNSTVGFQVRLLTTDEDLYTYENIATASGWSILYTGTKGYFEWSNDKYWVMESQSSYSSTVGYVDVYSAGDLANHWRFQDAEINTPMTIYYDSVAYAAHAYFDKEMTQDAGQLSNYFDDGHRYVKTAYYKWTRQDKGTDKTMIQKPWTGVDGLHADAFILESDSDLFPNGARTAAEDDRVYENVDGSEYFYENGRIHYNAVKLDPDTALESELFGWQTEYTGVETGAVEIVDDTGYKVLADEPLDTEEFTYESSILLCLDPSTNKVTFGDFRNNYMRDWAEGDTQGDGYTYDSYMIGHPVNVNDFVRQKSMPYLISYFKRSETGKTVTGEYLYGSKCQGSVRWDWRTDGLNSKWDRPNELYRPDKRTLLSQGYIITRTNIRGLGRAFQVKVQGVDDNNFIVEAFGFDLQHDERV